MNKKNTAVPAPNRTPNGTSCRRMIPGAVLLALLSPATHAFIIDTSDPDISMRWDNTAKYSAAFRLMNRSAALLTDVNQDDGDRNFNKGLISNRVDLLSEFDFTYKNSLGFRASAAAWYDDVYNQSNDNDSAATANNRSVAHDQFNDRTRTIHGRNVELLDAFVFANGEIGGNAANIRLGRHTLLYGESMFFGNNGIAAGQAPQDIVKLQSVPNAQFKETIRPVSQVSGQIQLTDRLALGAYYQFKWEKSIIPSAGSYFAATEVLEGGETFLLAGIPRFRVADQRPSDSGQGGMQIRWRPADTEMELGFYAIRFKNKNPQFYLTPSLNKFQLVYPDQGVNAYGASISGQIGEATVGAEASVRRNLPLVSDPVVLAGATVNADNRDNARYAIGNSAHLQANMSYIVQPTALWDTALLMGEVAWNRRTSITKNPAALAINSARDAWAMRLAFIPTWYQVATQLDVSMPIGIGYSAKGNSSVVSQFNPGGLDGGDLSVGVQGVYQQAWRFGVNYTHYFGQEGTVLQGGKFSFKQPLADRDFISLTVQRTF